MSQFREKMVVPLYEKYSLTFNESTEYFGIGDKKLRQIAADNPRAEYLLHIGTKTVIKRKMFELFLNETNSI